MIIALVGPVALWERLIQEYDRLTLAGAVVLLPCAARFRQAVSQEQIDRLNELHKEKIRMANRVVCVLPHWYVGGDGTRAEAAFAAQLEKPIEWVR